MSKDKDKEKSLENLIKLRGNILRLKIVTIVVTDDSVGWRGSGDCSGGIGGRSGSLGDGDGGGIVGAGDGGGVCGAGAKGGCGFYQHSPPFTPIPHHFQSFPTTPTNSPPFPSIQKPIPNISWHFQTFPLIIHHSH